MALTVDPSTFVITVPKADLTLIQSNPTEIRELNLNSFRLELKDWEYTGSGLNGGATFTKTHTHNTEVTLGGINYARIIEIIDPYTVTFEDGQYAVNLAGANSNVGDKTNVNQVSVRSQNSAGLISSADIEYASFNGYVLVDQVNGTDGTVFPAGTIRQPVKTLSDAKIIADFRGLKTIQFIGNGLITTGDSFDNFTFNGESTILSIITVDAGASVQSCSFRDATITGTLDGGSIVDACTIRTLNYVNGVVYNSMLESFTITLGGGAVAHFLNCFSGVPGTGTPIIDCGGSGQALALRNYAGGVTLINKTGADSVSVDFQSGQLRLATSVTGTGTIIARGDGKIVEDATDNDIPTGTWNTTVDILNETTSQIPKDVWDEPAADHETTDSTGERLKKASKALKTGEFIALK
jgi:hypothetical protein